MFITLKLKNFSRWVLSARRFDWRTVMFGAIGRKSILALVDQAVVSGTNFLTTVLIGRMCVKEELGIYALGFSIAVFIANMLDSLVCAPYTVFANRLRQRERAEYTGSIVVQYGLFSILVMLCLAVISAALSKYFDPGPLAALIWLLAGVIPFILLREFGRRFAFAHMQISSALLLDSAVALMQLTVLAWLAAKGLLSARSSYAAIGLVCALAGMCWLVLVRKSIRIRWPQVLPEFRRSWSFGKWVFGSRLISTVDAFSMPWLLAFMIGTAATGAFAACCSVVLFANPMLLGVANILFPKAAREFADAGAEEVRRVIWKTTRPLLFGMVSFCVLISLFSSEVMFFLYGTKYGGYEHAIIVLALAMLAGSLSIPLSAGLKAIEKPGANFRASLIGFGVTLVAAIILIPAWQVLGAAYSILAGSIVGSLVRWTFFAGLVATVDNLEINNAELHKRAPAPKSA